MKSSSTKVIIIGLNKLLLLGALLIGHCLGAEPESKEVTQDFWTKSPKLGVMTVMIAPVFGKKVNFEDVPNWDKELGSKFDAESWVRDFKSLGASYVYGVAKWHDGFCYWDTATTKFKSKRDYMGELVEECHKQGLRLSLYFNHRNRSRVENC